MLENDGWKESKQLIKGQGKRETKINRKIKLTKKYKYVKL